MQSEKTTKEGKQEKQRKTFAVYAVWLAKNVLFMVLALLLVKYTLTKQPAYRWVYSSLLKENMATIKKHPELTFEEKMKMKLGVDYRLSGKSAISFTRPVSCTPACSYWKVNWKKAGMRIG